MSNTITVGTVLTREHDFEDFPEGTQIRYTYADTRPDQGIFRVKRGGRWALVTDPHDPTEHRHLILDGRGGIWTVTKIPGLTVGERLVGSGVMSRLPDGARVRDSSRPPGRGEAVILRVGGEVAVRFDSSTNPITVGGRVFEDGYFTLVSLPEEEEGMRVFLVGQTVCTREEYEALPVGTKIRYQPDGSARVRTKVDSGWWATTTNLTGTDSASLDTVFGYVIEALPTGEPRPFEVGDRVQISDDPKTNNGGMVQDRFAGQVGIVMATVRAKEHHLGYEVATLDNPVVNWISGEHLTLLPPMVDETTALLSTLEQGDTIEEGPLSTETVRQFRARFRSLALSASHGSSIDMDPVLKYLALGGFEAEAVTVGMPVYRMDETTMGSLPEGTLLKQDTEGNPQLLRLDDASEPEHIEGSWDSDASSMYRVLFIPGQSLNPDPWVYEVMSTEWARTAYRQIEDLKLVIWDLGNKGKRESAEAGDEWCSVFERTLAQVGVDAAFAQQKGWTPEVVTEHITVSIRVNGVTSEPDDSDVARDMVAGSDVIVDSYSPARADWTWTHSIYDVATTEGECVCGNYDKDAVEEMLTETGINVSEFTFRVDCDND